MEANCDAIIRVIEHRCRSADPDDRVNKKARPSSRGAGPESTNDAETLPAHFPYQKLKSATRRLTMTCTLVASAAAFVVIAVAAA